MGLEALLANGHQRNRLVIAVAHATNLVKISPRCYSSLGLFAHYDGNIIGGVLLGTGMALANSCPGTVLAQVGIGMRSGLPVLGGAVLGGIVWTDFIRPRLRSSSSGNRPAATKEPSLTVYESLGVNEFVATAAFDALLVAAVMGLTVLSPPFPDGSSTHVIRPVVGGLFIGLSQLVSLLLRRTAVGVSTAYEEAGDLLWRPLCTSESDRPRYRSIMFAGGIVAGSWALSRVLPAVVMSDAPVPPSAPVWQSVLGGLLMVLGARIAGGCTSGHGITGMSLLSVSSFVTISSALVAGVLTANMFL